MSDSSSAPENRLRVGSSLTEAAEHFRADLGRKRRPQNTIKSYLYDLGVLAHEVMGKSINQIAAEDITRFLSEANPPTTRKRRLTSVRCFFRYLIDEAEVLSIDPTEGFFPNRIQLRIPDPLTPVEQSDLLEAAALDETWSRLAIELMMCHGLTRSELLSLDRGHIDRADPGAMRISIESDEPAKQSRNRLIRADEAFAETYERFLTVCIPVNRLFPIGFQAVNGMVDRVRRAAKIQRSVTPRTLRETYTIIRVMNGATEDELIRDLGLADEYRNRQSIRRFFAFVTE